MVLLIAAISLPMEAVADERRPAAFLDALIGAWSGRAETTPAGPRPYDMTFERLPDGRVAAIANPGRSRHHWWFGASKGRLQLTFLTTFAGNREPQVFLPATFTAEAAEFATKRADRLTVRVRLQRTRFDIDVMRHGRLHVAIRLVRAQGGG